nr:phage integrase family protein [Caballeronia sp. AZ1_KS37]
MVAFCNRRGPRWWRSIPRIGRGRASVGKGRRERIVPVSVATLAALRAHCADPPKVFNGAAEESKSGPLLAPMIAPWTDASPQCNPSQTKCLSMWFKRCWDTRLRRSHHLSAGGEATRSAGSRRVRSAPE